MIKCQKSLVGLGVQYKSGLIFSLKAAKHKIWIYCLARFSTRGKCISHSYGDLVLGLPDFPDL